MALCTATMYISLQNIGVGIVGIGVTTGMFSSISAYDTRMHAENSKEGRFYSLHLNFVRSYTL
jgi:hypothetical protein